MGNIVYRIIFYSPQEINDNDEINSLLYTDEYLYYDSINEVSLFS